MASFLSKWVLLVFCMSPVFSFGMPTSFQKSKIQCDSIFIDPLTLELKDPTSFKPSLNNSMIKIGWEFLRPLPALLDKENDKARRKYQEQAYYRRYIDISNFIYALSRTTKDLPEAILRLSSFQHELRKRQEEESMDLVLAKRRFLKHKGLWLDEEYMIESRQYLTARTLVMIKIFSDSLHQYNMDFFNQDSIKSLEQWRQNTYPFIFNRLTYIVGSHLGMNTVFGANIVWITFLTALEMREDPELHAFRLLIIKQMKEAMNEPITSFPESLDP